MFIDQKSLLPFPKVTPIRLPKIINLANTYWQKEFFKDNISVSNSELYNLEKNFRDWFNPLVNNLNEFKFVYYLNNGITQGLEFLGNHFKPNKIKMSLGDYFWLKTINCADEVPEISPCKISYSTSPSSIDGTINSINWPSEVHILDGAYVGTNNNKITPSENTKILLLGFSKNLGLVEFRSGLIFSKEKINILEIFQKTFNYIGLNNFRIISNICKNVPICELSEELLFFQKNYCNKFSELDLIPSDSALFATSNNKLKYDFYKRPNGVIRIPLGESITAWINSDNSTNII